MWKLNQFTIGDILTHKEAPLIEFQVYDVLRPVPDEKGKYLYKCKLLNESSSQESEFHNYQGVDLTLIRHGTTPELNFLLEEVLKEENYEVAETIRKMISD